ncbi:hypothetical protein [Carnimonas bestiolae]|uniref:hypothetical protein n=1 Tax=Carnimonas bestiolae TaxID=3402172 RepID=UPI003EDC4B7B
MTHLSFYAKAMAGLPQLVARLIDNADAPIERLAIILGDTARIAGLGGPADNPTPLEVDQWRQHKPPLWMAKTALFLLVQMPGHPLPDSDEERAAWAYTWLRIRSHASLDTALAALPEPARFPLRPYLEDAWSDIQRQRLL